MAADYGVSQQPLVAEHQGVPWTSYLDQVCKNGVGFSIGSGHTVYMSAGHGRLRSMLPHAFMHEVGWWSNDDNNDQH